MGFVKDSGKKRPQRSGPRARRDAPGRVDPAALTPVELARLLTAAGGTVVSAETIERHLDAGAPAAGGRINLVHYAAWLADEVARRASHRRRPP